MQNQKIYFAYGININQNQMKQRCPGAKILGTGYLEDYELQFKGVATIAKCESARTPVLAWTISDLNEHSLDLYEGFPTTYIKESYDIKIGGRTCTGMAYVLNKPRPLIKPTPQYYKTIAYGYRDAGFDIKFLSDAYKKAERAEMSRNRIYIAYGSNINQQQMAYRCPGAMPLCVGTVTDYQLKFRSYATIEPKEGFETPVLIWKISPEN